MLTLSLFLTPNSNSEGSKYHMDHVIIDYIYYV